MSDSADRSKTPLKKTPLFDRHIEAGARMAPFAGWEMPVSYRGINEEHAAVRSASGVFDVCHMGRLSVSGSRSLPFLNELLPRDVSKLSSGQMAYSLLCTEAGGVEDDLAVSKLQRDDYLLVVNASRAEVDSEIILGRAKEQSDVCIIDRTSLTGMVALQGPQSGQIMQEVLGVDLDELGYFRCREVKWAHSSVLVSRSGYTGEDGFELIIDRGDTVTLWDQLVSAGAVPCGLGARDTLRTEMGYCLYGHELTTDISPLEAGLGWAMNLEKPSDFLGKDALRLLAAKGPTRRLRGLVLRQRALPRPGCPVLLGDQQIGSVTSGTFSPTLQKGIALALLQTEALENRGGTITIDIRGRQHEADLVKPPFVQPNVKSTKQDKIK